MTHTAELRTPLTASEYESLIHINGGVWERGADNKLHYHIRTLRGYGITDIRPQKYAQRLMYYYCTIIINLHRIAHADDHQTQTYDNEYDFPALAENFSMYISSILPLHTDINTWDVHRIDYNIDLKMSPKRVEQYIILLQRGGKHYSWSVHEFAEEKKKRAKHKHGKRKQTHPTDSVLYDNKQYSVNIYNKYRERLKDQEERGIIDTEELDACLGVLRIEIQVKKGKINTIKNEIKGDFDFQGKPLEAFARYSVAVPIIMSALSSIYCASNYTTLCKALERIQTSIRYNNVLLDAEMFLRLVARFKSLWRAKEEYNCKTSIPTILKHLKDADINPVTIPKSFGVDTLESIINLVAVQFTELREAGEVYFITENE